MNGSAPQFDVAIVGAGPAGSSMAIRLALAGLSVLLVEKAKFPREKLCGEFISPECLAHFTELGVTDTMATAGGTALQETIFFTRGGKGVSVESSWFGTAGTSALGLSRARMDLELLERARALGVDVREATTVTSLLIEDEKVVGIKLRSDDNSSEEITSGLTIDATGRTRALARRFDGDLPKEAARSVAFKTHLRGARLNAGACEIYAYRGGYGGCSSIEGKLYNLCFIASAEDTKRLGSDPERVMREVVFTNRRAAEAMKDAVVAKPWLAVPIQSFGRGTLVPAEGLITVGDSAAFIDPFTGSGMLLALESAKIASAAVIGFRERSEFHNLAAHYRKNYAAAFDRRLRICSLLRHASTVPLFGETVIRLLSTSRPLTRRVARSTRLSAGPAS